MVIQILAAFPAHNHDADAPSFGDNHACLLYPDGVDYCRGDNDHGQADAP
jgi:hypothetical protein